MKKKSFAFHVCGLSLVLLFTSCSHDLPAVVYAKGTNEDVNLWMYQQMKRYYYWNETMPNEVDLSLQPQAYFASLLQNDDRFSYALNTASPSTFPKNIRSSFGFDISFVTFDGKIYGVVLYVLSGSPAANKNLQRGQLITSIGGKVVTKENYNELYQNLSSTANASLEIISYTEKLGFSNSQQVNIYSGFSLLQPIRNQVITQLNYKVGYIEIPHFDIGLSQSLLQVFSKIQGSISH